LPLGEIEIGSYIVGWWFAGTGGPLGDFGFVYWPNVAIFGPDEEQLDLDSTQTTFLQAVNNAGLAVGEDDSGFFKYDTNSGALTYLPVSCDISMGCVALGINDAGWIVGAVNANFDNSRGFVYKPGQPPIMLTEGMWNEISGINGQGIITGYYSPDDNSVYGFIGDASQDTITILQDSIVCPNGYTVMYPGAINNNSQVAGYSYDADGAGNEAGFWFDPKNPNSCQDLSYSFLGGEGVAYGLNDFAQIVGEDSGPDANAIVLFPVPQ